MTIKGVKNELNLNNSELDENYNRSINSKNILKSKIKNISKIIKEIKTKYLWQKKLILK